MIKPLYNRILTLFIFCSATLSAQPNELGMPLITNYHFDLTGGSEQNWCITRDHRGIMYFGNNDRGILEYDGQNWRIIPLENNPIVRSMATGSDGMVYVGAEGDFGRLEPDSSGALCFQSLAAKFSDEESFYPMVWKTYAKEGHIYFCTPRGIYIYEPENDQTNSIPTPENTFESFFIGDTLYTVDWDQGLLQYNGVAYDPVPGGELFAAKQVFGMKAHKKDLLVATFANGLYLLDRERGRVKPDFIDPALNTFLKENLITSMIELNGHILIGTKSAGLVQLDSAFKIRAMINRDNGLPNSTITDIFIDRDFVEDAPLWITHWRGVSKIEFNNPFRLFAEESGLEDLVTDIAIFNGQLFVSTLGGLYCYQASDAGSRFTKQPGLKEEIWSLHVTKPIPGKELLLVSTDRETYILDKHHQLSKLSENVINPPEEKADLEEYACEHFAQHPQRNDIIYTGLSELVELQYLEGKWRENARFRNLQTDIIHRLACDGKGRIWITAPLFVLAVDLAGSKLSTGFKYDSSKGLPTDEDNLVFIDPKSQEVLVGSRQGFFRFDAEKDHFFPDTVFNPLLPPGSNQIRAFHYDGNAFWLSFDNEQQGWMEMMIQEEGGVMSEKYTHYFKRLPNASADVFCEDERGVWFSKSDELYHFNKHISKRDSLPFRALIREVRLNNDSLIFFGSHHLGGSGGQRLLGKSQAPENRPDIEFRYNDLFFKWSAPCFEEENKLEYSYRLLGFKRNSTSWSEWSSKAEQNFTNLRWGSYEMQVKAKNIYGIESLPASYAFTILRPWYATRIFLIMYFLFGIMLVYLITRLYTRRLVQENIRLEGIISERTAEIRKQKEELTDSIEYASRIQRALLPPDRLMDLHGIEHFIFFKPREIVSGDFYWMGTLNGKLYVVAADCTGHGVPGAFMSMLGISFLEEIILKSKVSRTDDILERLREQVITSLKQSGQGIAESSKDGMDLSLIAIDTETKSLQFSGAYNPLYLVRPLNDTELARVKAAKPLKLPRGAIHNDSHLLLQIQADKMPIGISEKTMPFNARDIPNEGYRVYMFSDGYIDQFGGPRGKKFLSKNFKRLILDMQATALKEQAALFEKALQSWMGQQAQIDDILVIGISLE
ncbi:MAG: hypothetical protein CSA96_04835 [Bacteroidetes bacterium]|nr:MAG: hypothetical protein CSA96_04835 [Bacteroidota bacterium]